MSDRIDAPIVILGAGPAGSTASLQLSLLGIDHLLVDKAVFPRDKICGDALSGKVVEVMKKIDPTIVDRLHLEPTQVGSWGVNFVAPNGKELRIPFKTNYDTSTKPPGYITKRLDFDNFLLEEALVHKQVTFMEATELSKFERTGKGITGISKDGELQISSPMWLVADGANSRFARHFGHLKMEPKHHCAGIRAYYKGVEGMDKDNFIELHFLKQLLPGYFWAFPLPNGMANIGLGIRSDRISKEKINLKEKLQEVLATEPALKERFKNAELEGKVQGFGLPLGTKKRALSGDNYLLLGDAGSLIDPFTGEGIGNAMMCGWMAALHAQKNLAVGDHSIAKNKVYDKQVYDRLWSELSLSRRMQQLVTVPWLFNFVVNKAINSPTLQETISCMFEDLDIRDRLKQPSFYVNLLLSK